MTTFSCYDLQMAFSKLTSAKLMKTVGSYDQAELMEAMDNIEIDQMQQTHKILRALHNNLKALKAENLQRKKRKRRNPKSSVCKKQFKKWLSKWKERWRNMALRTGSTSGCVLPA